MRPQKAHDASVPDLHTQTLVRAALVLGDVNALAERLALPAETLARYMRQELKIPMEVFLRASEIVTEGGVLEAAKTGQSKEPPTW